MDDAIANAEREAQLASLKANGAAQQLVEWTQGEKTVIKNLKRIGAVISSPEFQAVNSAFVEQHRSVFEATDENKFEYSALHEQYVEKMEATLTDLAKEVNMDELIANLPDFMQGRVHEVDPEGTASTIDFLLSLTDFSTFKNMMLAANMADEAPAGGPVLALAANDDAPLAMLEKTQMPKVVVDTARVLLQLSEGGEQVQWAKAVEKKNELLLETTSIKGARYARLSMLVDLPISHIMPCMLDMAVEGREKWNQMAEKVDVVRDERAGKLVDTISTIHFKMPGVAKLIKSIPTNMTVRIAIQQDLPEPGHLTYVMIGWNPKADAPETGAMSMMRVATIEPVGENASRLKTIDKQMQAVPEWLSNLWVSNTMAKQVKTDIMRYKKIKGLK